MRLQYHDIGPMMASASHGVASKNKIVLHETVSPDEPGWEDINDVAAYLDRIDYGMHGLVDAEGHIAWARGFGKAIFYHAQGENLYGIGIEQVSKVMIEYPTNVLRRQAWTLRQAELRATAKLCAAIHNTWDIPLEYSDGIAPGVTTHWDVTHAHHIYQGHTDCFPYHKGGYYPVLQVIRLAKVYAATGLTL